MGKNYKYIKCPTCKGSGKIRETKMVRQWCDECQDKGHGCFGSGEFKGGREIGHIWCCTTQYVCST